MTSVAIEPPRQPEVLGLLRESDLFHLELYPPESCHLLDVAELEHPGVTFFVGRGDGVALGTAAVLDRGDGTGEIKRMFVSADARGRGLARSLLAAVEARASELGIHTLQLETGPLQHAAIALYQRSGYAIIPNFGPYAGDPHSICMEKALPIPLVE
ncbi:MAG TPA: GNAT family N-acetyltransferase [Galbitalea sp.]|jgi:putative acetyltransferase